MAVCALASFGYAALQPVSYRAEASVLPSQGRDLVLDAGSAGIVRRPGRYLESLKGSSIGRSMLQRFVPCTVEGRPDSVRLRSYFGRSNIKQALDGLAACSEFKQNAPGVLTVAVTLDDFTMAAAVANAYLEELIILHTDKRQKRVQEDVEFIGSRLKAMEADLRAAEDSIVAFRRFNISIQDPQLSLRLSHLQRRADLKSELHTILAKQYEMARIRAREEVRTFEVLHYARPVDAVSSSSSRKRTALLAAAVGLFLSVFLAFFLEYLERNQKAGRMEPILNELRKDTERIKWVFGWKSGKVKEKTG